MKKWCVKSKKGLSPVVATVLLIMLVLILFALIFLWMKGFFKEQIEKNEQAIENVCPSVNFEVDLVNEGSSYYLETINRGSVHIHSLEIKMIDEGGDAELYNSGGIDLSVSAGETNRKGIILKMKNMETPEKIIVYPILIGSVKGGKENKPYTCTDMGKTLNVIQYG
jgi:flagellin-like protein